MTQPKSSTLFGPSIRLTLLSSCQSGCDFCHLEGYKSPSEIGLLNPAIIGWKTTKELDNAVDSSDVEKTIAIAQALGVPHVNITGGEPTLFPGLATVIKQLDDAGLSVSITTHAEISPDRFARYLEAGLDWVILSIHAVTPDQYLGMDLVAQQIEAQRSKADAIAYAARRLALKKANLRLSLEARETGKLEGVLTNTVMRDVEQTSDVITYCTHLGLIPRIQYDLNNRPKSKVDFQHLLRYLGAERCGVRSATADSSGAGEEFSFLDSEGSVRRFKLKDFGYVYVPEMCDQCEMKSTETCRERFYGVRVEKGKVRTCIDRTVAGITVFEGDAFIRDLKCRGSVPNAIATQYSQGRD